MNWQSTAVERRVTTHDQVCWNIVCGHACITRIANGLCSEAASSFVSHSLLLLQRDLERILVMVLSHTQKKYVWCEQICVREKYFSYSKIHQVKPLLGQIYQYTWWQMFIVSIWVYFKQVYSPYIYTCRKFQLLLTDTRVDYIILIKFAYLEYRLLVSSFRMQHVCTCWEF